jgi:hypothetical protein
MLTILLASFIILSFALLTISAIMTVADSPSFDRAILHTRINMGKHTMLISARPSIKWEEPVAHFDVGSMTVNSGSMFCSELWS